VSDFDDDEDASDMPLAGRRVNQVRARAGDLRRSASLARTEAAAGILDVARTFLRGIADNEPISDSRYWSDVARRSPNTLSDALDAALDTAAEVPRRVIDRFYGEYDMATRDRAGSRTSSASRTAGRKTARDTGRQGAGISRGEQRVLDLVDAFLSQVPGDGARLRRVVDNVVLETDYDRDIVTSIIKRNYINNGNVISKTRTIEDIETKDSTKDYMRDILIQRGFEDIRSDVDLTGLPELEDAAALVAYRNGEPVVLCYPVADGEVDDSGNQEAAIFQANAIAPGQVASFVWVSDGDSNYIYDVAADQVVSRLPDAQEPRSSQDVARAAPSPRPAKAPATP